MKIRSFLLILAATQAFAQTVPVRRVQAHYDAEGALPVPVRVSPVTLSVTQEFPRARVLAPPIRLTAHVVRIDRAQVVPLTAAVVRPPLADYRISRPAILADAGYAQRWASDTLYTNLQDAIRDGDQVLRLTLTRQQTGYVPPAVFNLRNLRVLNLSNMGFSELPRDINRLTRLESLNLSGNQLRVLPDEILALTNLVVLGLDNNQLSELPQHLERLSLLRKLGLSYNQFDAVPPAVFLLTSLESLDLSGNRFTVLPWDVVRLEHLQYLHLMDSHVDAQQIADLQADLPTCTIYSDNRQ